LKLALVRFVLIVAAEGQAAVLAVTNVEDSEVDFGSSPPLVEASVLHDASVRCVAFPARLTHIAVIVWKEKIEVRG
jgi:hypothetical protein